jgi:2Fe-2S ferredoxin
LCTKNELVWLKQLLFLTIIIKLNSKDYHNMDVLIKIKDREGVVHELQAPTDMAMNIMELCKAYELPVEGTCGGMAMCASCQCYVLNEVELSPMGDEEEAMLSEAFYVKPNSRLGCQIPITMDLEGLELELAPEN